MEAHFNQSKAMVIIYAILLIIIGALFIADKDLALQWGFIIAGVFLIISGILPMIQYKTVDLIGVIFIVLGFILIAAPYVFAVATEIIIGIIAIIIGIVIAFNALQATETKVKIIGLIVGILVVIAGAITFLGNDFVFIVFGILLIIAGIMNLITLSSTTE
jgi:uncharacterized membrane protein HdeD (DUF308 family)